MKKKLLILLGVLVCILGCFMLSSVVLDKFTPVSFRKAVEDLTADEPEIIQTYGDISVTKGELEMAKVTLVKNAEPDTSTEAALRFVLKRKLLVNDAKGRGLEVEKEDLKKHLSEVRKNLGVTEDGKITTDCETKTMLEESGVPYSMYEKVVEMNLRYTLVYYDYAQLICAELKEKQPDVVFDDEMVDQYLEVLLSDLIQNESAV